MFSSENKGEPPKENSVDPMSPGPCRVQDTMPPDKHGLDIDEDVECPTQSLRKEDNEVPESSQMEFKTPRETSLDCN